MQMLEIERIHEFLRHTPEERVRKALLSTGQFTATEARLALKIARACDPAEFALFFKVEDFPQLKMTAAEMKWRDQFWPRLKATLRANHLLSDDRRPRERDLEL